MTIKEIKENLGIDLSIQSRKVPTVVLKALYVEQQYNNLKHIKQSELLKLLCADINCQRSNIYNYIKKLKNYKLDKATQLIVKAFNQQDKQYIDKYYEHIKQASVEYRSQWYKQKRIEDFCKELDNKKRYSKPFIPKKPKVVRPMNNLQVADYLKANKILRGRKYWDRLLTDYTEEDWFNLREINPTMFDNYIK